MTCRLIYIDDNEDEIAEKLRGLLQKTMFSFKEVHEKFVQLLVDLPPKELAQYEQLTVIYVLWVWM